MLHVGEGEDKGEREVEKGRGRDTDTNAESILCDKRRDERCIHEARDDTDG